MDLADDPHYRAIAAHYGDRRARRSFVPLIRHIDEGLRVLNALGASLAARRAYCLHPLVQGDADLAAALRPEGVLRRWVIDPYALELAMEYRAVANAYLSHREIESIDEIALSPLPEVRQMLVADKVQNRKDFERYHRGVHPRSDALDRYFRLWLRRLGIDEDEYARLVSVIDAGS